MKISYLSKALTAAVLTVSLFVATAARADQFDVPAICESSVHALFLEYLNEIKARETLFQKEPSVIANEIFLYTPDPELAPWRLQDVSQPNALKAAHLIQLRFAEKMIDLHFPGVTIRELLQRAAGINATYSQGAIDQARLVINSIHNSDLIDEDAYAKVSKYAEALCAPYLTVGCAKAVRAVLKVVDARVVQNVYVYMSSGVSVSQPQAVAKFLSEPSIRQGFSYFALRLMDKVENGIPLGKSLFDDLVDSFKQFGLSQVQAEENAWTVLAFYSTRGASLAMFEGVPNNENLPVMVAAYVMSTAIGLIDAETAPSGHAYSYPAEISGTCKMDRPYHFWMAASLVRNLIKSGHSRKAAAAAVQILGKLYEFSASVSGRDGSRIFIENYMGPYAQMVRIGLAYRAAGILWASKLKSGPLNFDNALIEILSASEPVSKMTAKKVESASELQRYLWFNKIIAPDAALKKFGPF